jgi:hypothetical protein
MIGLLKKLRRNERGNVLILTAAAMPLLVGSAGLAVDTIQWALWKRQLQKAADSAAIAGVYAQLGGQDVTTAVRYDLGHPTTTLPNNNRTGMALLNDPVISFPADTDDWTDGVSVRLQVQQTLPFSSMFMAATPIIEANATAAGIETGEYCAQAQINTGATGISAGGTVNVNLRCGIITNSTSMDAAVAFGASLVTATPVAAVGGLDKTDNWAAGTTLLPFTLAQPDPFADINPPPIPSDCKNKFDDKPSDNQTWPTSRPADGIVCVTDWTSQGTVNLQPNTTYIITGDMKVNSSAKISCTGCTFVMTDAVPSNTGTVDIAGGAQLNLTAPDSGTYQGILFYSNRGADKTDTSKINGNSNSTFQGAFYFPAQQVEYTGTAGVTFECIKLVSWQLTFKGTANINNNCPEDWYGDRFVGRHVRLVA